MKPITLFTWGYWGWGGAPQEFVRGADAVEKSRGFKPPVFVDIRILRNVKAKGFCGNASTRARRGGRRKDGRG